MIHAFFVAAALTATPSDGTSVAVSGVTQHVQTGHGRHPYVLYDVCDASGTCVHVVNFGSAAVAAGHMQTVTGTFRRLIFVGGKHVMNAIVIGRP